MLFEKREMFCSTFLVTRYCLYFGYKPGGPTPVVGVGLKLELEFITVEWLPCICTWEPLSVLGPGQDPPVK